tara:strand:+ start:400 stop:594 length:195 start_codon:yes stop_codon:yes gene_type:complete
MAKFMQYAGFLACLYFGYTCITDLFIPEMSVPSDNNYLRGIMAGALTIVSFCNILGWGMYYEQK